MGCLEQGCRGGCSWRLGCRAVGGRCASRLYRVSQGDEVDAESAPFFVNSSLAPVLLFRGRLKSVADVLKGIGEVVLQRYWGAVCRHGFCGHISSLDPWDGWIHLLTTSQHFYSSILDAWRYRALAKLVERNGFRRAQFVYHKGS